MPLAFAAMGQAIVIISGGIDLSIGSLMSLDQRARREAGWCDTSFRAGAAVRRSLLVLLGVLAGALTGC